MTKIKKQHYVPQFYLRRFATADRLFAFDKVTGRVIPTNVRDIASDRFFYDSPKLDQIAGQSQALEKFFHPFEKAGAAAIRDILSHAGTLGALAVTKAQRVDLALYLALQYLRTKETRELLVQTNALFYKEAFLKHMRENHPDFPIQRDWFTLETSEEAQLAIHAAAILDEELREQVALTFLQHYWIVLRNSTSTPFYTSDHPAVNHGTFPHPEFGLNVINSIGAEVAFPLSSDMLLLLLERNAFPHAKSFDCTLQTTDNIENVIYYNSHQVRYSYRQIYCRDSDFDLAQSMLEESPELGNPKFARVDVH